MSILAGVLASVIEWLLTKFENWIGQEYSQYQANQAIKAQAAADAQQLKDAKTAQEKTDAADKINHDTFGS